jgi:protein TonB
MVPIAEIERAAHQSLGGTSSNLLTEELGEIVKRAQTFTRASSAGIALVEGNELVTYASCGTSAPDVGSRRAIDGSFSGICVQSKKVQRCDDTSNDPRVEAASCEALKIRCMVLVPILDDEVVLGVLAVFSNTPQAHTNTHVAVLKTMAEVITEKVRKARRQRVSLVSLTEGVRVVTGAPELPRKPEQARLVAFPSKVEPSAPPVVRTEKYKPEERIHDDLLLPAEDPHSNFVPAAAEPGRVPTFGVNSVLGRMEEANSKPGLNVPRLLATGVVALILVAGVAGFLIRASAGKRAPAVSEIAPAPPVLTVESPATALSAAPAVPELTIIKAPEAPVAKPVPEPQPAVVVPIRKDVLLRRPSAVSAATTGEDVAPPEATQLATSAGPAIAFHSQPLPSGPTYKTSKLESAALIHKVSPVYPAIASRLKLHGRVTLNVKISPEGLVSEVRAVEGDPILGNAAVAAVKQWRYRAATLNGVPTESDSEIVINFAPPPR